MDSAWRLKEVRRHLWTQIVGTMGRRTTSRDAVKEIAEDDVEWRDSGRER